MTATPARENTAEHVARGTGGRWLPGACPNPGGRPKTVADIQELAREHSPKAIARLAQIAENGQSEAAQIAASVALLDRAYGKPTQPLSGDDSMGPIRTAAMTQREIEERRAAAAKLINDAFEALPHSSNSVVSGG
jgi:hypothetical protein